MNATKNTLKTLRTFLAMMAVGAFMWSCSTGDSVNPRGNGSPSLAAQGPGDTIHIEPDTICGVTASGNLVDALGQTGSGNFFGADTYGTFELITTPYDMLLQISLNRGWFVASASVYMGPGANIPVDPNGVVVAENMPLQATVLPVRNIYEVSWPITPAMECPNTVWTCARLILVELDFGGTPYNDTPVWLEGQAADNAGSQFVPYCAEPCGRAASCDIVASAVSTNATSGNSDGTATASETGGVAPVSYLWDNGATTAVVTGLAAGDYCVVATDANGCSDTTCVTVGTTGGNGGGGNNGGGCGNGNHGGGNHNGGGSCHGGGWGGNGGGCGNGGGGNHGGGWGNGGNGGGWGNGGNNGGGNGNGCGNGGNNGGWGGNNGGGNNGGWGNGGNNGGGNGNGCGNGGNNGGGWGNGGNNGGGWGNGGNNGGGNGNGCGNGGNNGGGWGNGGNNGGGWGNGGNNGGGNGNGCGNGGNNGGWGGNNGGGNNGGWGGNNGGGNNGGWGGNNGGGNNGGWGGNNGGGNNGGWGGNNGGGCGNGGGNRNR